MTNADLQNLGICLVAVAVLLVVCTIWYYPIYNARRRHHSKAETIAALTYCSLLVGFTWIIAIAWSYSENNAERRGFPVAIPDADDGPGRYEIAGIDKQTKMDTKWAVTAESKRNALVKADLEGIIVTDIQRA